MTEDKPRLPWIKLGCFSGVLAILMCSCILTLLGGFRILGEPPAFHNGVYRNDRMLYHRWRSDFFVEDKKGAAIIVDLHREYVLCLLLDKSRIGVTISSERDDLSYAFDMDGIGTVSGTVISQTIEVVDPKTGRRTTTHMGPGDAFEWKAAMERAGSGGGDVKPDFRAMLIERGIALP